MWCLPQATETTAMQCWRGEPRTRRGKRTTPPARPSEEELAGWPWPVREAPQPQVNRRPVASTAAEWNLAAETEHHRPCTASSSRGKVTQRGVSSVGPDLEEAPVLLPRAKFTVEPHEYNALQPSPAASVLLSSAVSTVAHSRSKQVRPEVSTQAALAPARSRLAADTRLPAWQAAWRGVHWVPAAVTLSALDGGVRPRV